MNFTSDLAVFLTYIVGLGIFYGYTNARLKNLEEKYKSHNDLIERITRLEEKINILLEYKIMSK